MGIKPGDSHLGDGAYAEFSSFDVVVKADRQDGCHYIHLDPRALQSLVDLARGRGWRIK